MGILIMTGIACLDNSLSPSYSYALPTWETFHDSICQITIKHPYVTDKIARSGDNAFEIEIAKDISDPDSISMTIEGTCLPDSMPITKEMYNLTLASLKDNYKRIIYQDGTFNKIGPDDESKTYISITGLSGDNGQLKGNSILTAIKNNMTYIVKLNATGEDGNSGFVNNYRYFEDNVLDSLNLTR